MGLLTSNTGPPKTQKYILSVAGEEEEGVRGLGAPLSSKGSPEHTASPLFHTLEREISRKKNILKKKRDREICNQSDQGAIRDKKLPRRPRPHREGLAGEGGP